MDRGVVDFISAADLGPANQTPAVLTPERKTLAGRKILAEVGPDKPGVEFWGQALGIILADSKEHAEFAAKHGVKVTYSGQKKPVVTIDQAVAAGGEYVTTTQTYDPLHNRSFTHLFLLAAFHSKSMGVLQLSASPFA